MNINITAIEDIGKEEKYMRSTRDHRDELLSYPIEWVRPKNTWSMPYTKRSAITFLKKNWRILLEYLDNLENEDIALERRTFKKVHSQSSVNSMNFQ